MPNPHEQIAARIVKRNRLTPVKLETSVYCEGEIIQAEQGILSFRNGHLVDGDSDPIKVADLGKRKPRAPGYLEMFVSSPEGDSIFRSKLVLGLYSIYSAQGKKSFFSDNAYKYGAPPVITMMAEFGRFIDGYPAVHIDRDNGIGETLVLINPYKRPILANIKSSDKRSLPRLRIPAESVKNVDLSHFLEPEENTWMGEIQLTANNRLITFSIKHDYSDPTLISDHEHLDPYRSDPTFLPMTLHMRRWLGGKLATVRGWL